MGANSIEEYASTICRKSDTFNPASDPFDGQWEEGYDVVREDRTPEMHLIHYQARCLPLRAYLLETHNVVLEATLSGDELKTGIAHAESILFGLLRSK